MFSFPLLGVGSVLTALFSFLVATRYPRKSADARATRMGEGSGSRASERVRLLVTHPLMQAVEFGAERCARSSFRRSGRERMTGATSLPFRLESRTGSPVQRPTYQDAPSDSKQKSSRTMESGRRSGNGVSAGNVGWRGWEGVAGGSSSLSPTCSEDPTAPGRHPLRVKGERSCGWEFPSAATSLHANRSSSAHHGHGPQLVMTMIRSSTLTHPVPGGFSQRPSRLAMQLSLPQLLITVMRSVTLT